MMNAKGFYLEFNRLIVSWISGSEQIDMTPEKREQFHRLLDALDDVSAELQKFFYSLPEEKK